MLLVRRHTEGIHAVLRLADYQVRLLLCRPDRKESLNGYSAVRLHWKCGCSATEDTAEKYAVEACGYHHSLFQQITEEDERRYEGVQGDEFFLPPAI